MSTGGVTFCTHKLGLITQALNPGWNPLIWVSQPTSGGGLTGWVQARETDC